MSNSTEGEIQYLEDLLPRQIVAQLDKYIVGQHAAKRAVAIALSAFSSPRVGPLTWPMPAPLTCKSSNAQRSSLIVEPAVPSESLSGSQ